MSVLVGSQRVYERTFEPVYLGTDHIGGPGSVRRGPPRRFGRWLLAATCLVIGAGAVPAAAQDEQSTPYFRVPMGASPTSANVEATYAWLESAGACSTTCGTGTRTTEYQCQNVADFDYGGTGYGLPEAEASCTASAGIKPLSTFSSCTLYSGCGYDWVKPPVVQTPIAYGSNPVGHVGCGFVNTRYQPYCQRTGGGANVVLAASDHRFCASDRPDYDDVAAGSSDALGFDRNGAQETSCQRTDHDWVAGSWGSWTSECSTKASRTRAVTCTRRWNAEAKADAECDDASRPSSVETAARYESCSYTAVNPGTWSAWASGCSASTIRTRQLRCQRSNDGGQIVADDECTGRGIQLVETQTGANYASCTHAWQTGDWSSWNSGCSPVATRSRSVSCVRSSDGAAVADTSCDASERPSSSETIAQYGSCTFAKGGEVNASAWSSGCSGKAQRTHYFACVRSDGTGVDASECTNRNISVSSVEEAANFSGCTYALEDAGVGACQRSGQAPHYWRCRRSDGSEVDSATYCGRSNPTLETCSYPWTYSAAYGGWSECTGGAQTRAIASCTREDGTSVPTSLCTAAGIAAEQSQSCTSALARWDAFKGVCDGEIASYTISDARKGMPDAVAYKQACADRGGACFMHQMSETHDYDGRQESYQESYSCGTNAISKPEAVGSWSNANGSGFVYTEVKL